MNCVLVWRRQKQERKKGKEEENWEAELAKAKEPALKESVVEAYLYREASPRTGGQNYEGDIGQR